MSNPKQQRQFDPTSFTLHTQENFYTPQDLEAVARDWPREEVAEAFAAYRTAVDVGDHDTMTAMLTDDGRGGNATYGFFHDHASYRQFLKDCWLEIIPNHNMWQMIDGGRVLNKWCEVLPGDPPGGGRYDYFGINEVIYAGGGQFRLMYSLPDLFGLNVLYLRWKADGQHETYGDLYPSI
ncbi:MAG: hypothetical protein JRG96_11165, partial [Deltaproteobacteria bacterium]|nr:hypothetical protein [Deltaproteobacteria bacterium]